MPPYPGTEENSWWVALGCTGLAIAAVSSEQAQRILPDDIISHTLGCGILALTFFCMFIVFKASQSRHWKPAPRPVDRVAFEDRKDLTIMKGVVKKYSDKKRWGVISVHPDSDSESDDETRVRFLEKERHRANLAPGDHVVFRAIADPEMEGWLLAETVWKAAGSIQPDPPSEGLTKRGSRTNTSEQKREASS
ncbi:unnamed protein product [Effrenium voratum]|nr:unnamed protein product [Effrenium voratum]CAJ1453471.1 unnamed protein product [Effrenium voratum]